MYQAPPMDPNMGFQGQAPMGAPVQQAVQEPVVSTPQPVQEAVATPQTFRCPNCGNEVKQGELFCFNCGTKLG